jgi:Fe-S-cluster containining protein
MLLAAVEAAAGRPEVRDAVARVYAELQVEIDARKPKCSMSGRCCRFEEFGHRLYVTTIELAAFAHRFSSSPSPGTPGEGWGEGSRRERGSDERASTPPNPHPASPGVPGEERKQTGGCPFQIEGLCSVHTVRPFGCRVFFCDETSADWQHTQYERFHAQIKRLHEELEVPYRYLEWRAALKELNLAIDPKPNPLSLPQLRL